MGGGRIWMETPLAERFSGERLEAAVAQGAEEFVTTCPYCITNFEDRAVRSFSCSFLVCSVCVAGLPSGLLPRANATAQARNYERATRN
jgi:hypothetical protein